MRSIHSLEKKVDLKRPFLAISSLQFVKYIDELTPEETEKYGLKKKD